MIFFTATIYKNIIDDSTALNCVNGEPVCPFNAHNIILACKAYFCDIVILISQKLQHLSK